MSNGVIDEAVLSRLRERNPRYGESAYLFVLTALHRVLQRLDQPRHISGRELAQGARDLALEQFGPMARTVLAHWGISATEDLGEIVFGLVECGILIKQDDDSPSDFADVYDFVDAFDRDYPWGANL
ncbi:MAG: Minf_1886 family protein [Longimicrobiales bacterium]